MQIGPYIVEDKMGELVAKTHRAVGRRANRVTTEFIRRERLSNRLVFNAGEHDKKYKVSVKVEDGLLSRLHKIKISDVDVKINCECEAFLYQGADYHADKHNVLDGESRAKGKAPQEGKPRQFMCKHIYAVYNDFKDKEL